MATEEILEETEEVTEQTEEDVTIVSDILMNIAVASENLKNAEKGSKERETESRIYDSHMEKVVDFERLELEKRKFELEDKKAFLLAQLEERKVLLEEKKAELIAMQEGKKDKNEMTKFWVSSGINLLRILLCGFFSFTNLFYNLKFGGMMGRDSQHYFKELFKRD